MKIKPLRHYRYPMYPTSDLFKMHPKMLAIVPKHWRKNTFLLSFLITFCAVGTGIQKVHAADLYYGYGVNDFELYYEIGTHLSEQDAHRIMIDETTKVGIHLENFPLNLRTLRFLSSNISSQTKPHSFFYHQNQIEPMENAETSMPSLFPTIYPDSDLIDFNRKIVCAYISDNDALAAGYASPVKAGQMLSEEFDSTNTDFKYGIFSSSNEENLRFQVRSFIEWLKIQGVL